MSQSDRVNWFDAGVRNRALVVLALIALAPVALEAVQLPVRMLDTRFLGSALSLTLSGDTLLITLLPALTCAGTDWVLRAHPDVVSGEVPYLFPFWVAPAFTALATAVVLSRALLWPLWVLTLLLGVAATGVLILTEWFTISPGTPGYAVSRLVLTAGVYATAFVLFTLVYSTRERSVISATLTILVAFGLSLDLLSPHIIGLRSSAVQSGVIALLIGEATWALNYWNISNWSAGVLLLTLFYVLVGLAQQHFQDRLTRSVLIEFGAVSIVALVVAWQLAGIR